MGCQKGDDACFSDEESSPRVQLSPFHMDTTEVTVAAYTQCVHDGNCEATNTEDDCNYSKAGKQEHPINCVTWYQSKKDCEAQGKRLPTEAEWEHAARAQDEDIYPWGKTKPTDRLARFNLDSDAGTEKVKSYPAGANGLYDMAGNMWEWVEDCYDSDIYKSRSGTMTSKPHHQPKGCPSGRRV
ncbi:MAG: formylglycine-generating enzyme family protein [Myxococcales bacterium]|nr:formylglycine-generating enzyme family protein [Myxococcales bacterium]